MSRISNKILTPLGVKCSIDGSSLIISGASGTVTINIHNLLLIDLTDGVRIDYKHNLSKNDIRVASAIAGTLSRIVCNAVKDVTNGFTVNLSMVGVGFNASIKNNFLYLSVGYSHDVVYAVSAEMSVKIIDNTNIAISGCDRQKVMQFANKIRSVKSPEPYKGKGLFVNDEIKSFIKKEVKKKK